ncbi:MAG: potassium/proton antiporter [Candidatus Hydrogenedentales bacterium]|jgi:cell volume regulation protein A
MIDPSLILLVIGFLVLVSILASRVSDRAGVPTLIVFLCIGMLAGSDGPGGIAFNNTQAANLIGTVALAFILFAGGLDTHWGAVRPVLGRGILLATAGVVITAGLVGLFLWKVLGFEPLTGLLIGSIVSSTDAAAVFAIMRRRGVSLKGHLKPLLELESGSNDPMAIFLTAGVTRLLMEPDFEWMSLLPALAWNMLGGMALGLLAGKLAALLFNRIRLGYEGLYPVLSISIVLLTFGITQFIQCNGYLAVYLCGIMLNASRFNYHLYVAKFHDGLAWLMQIGLFLVLGLLVNPSQLPRIALTAAPIVLFLMAVARPIAVALGLVASSFSWRERALAAWTGLRGAVPIVLATFPLMAGFSQSDMVFNIVFFIVLTSVLAQGTFLMPVARWLKVDKPLPPLPRYTLQIQREGRAQGETRELEILPSMAAVGRTLADLDIPPGVLILLIGRGDGFVVPRGQTRIEPYDTLLMMGDSDALRDAGDAILSPRPKVRQRAPQGDPLEMLPENTDEKFLSQHVVVAGYGRIGRRIYDKLKARNVPLVVLDQDRELIQELRQDRCAAVAGDASTAMALAQAHVARAAMLVVATPDALKVAELALQARQLNPNIEIVICAKTEMEAKVLEHEKAGTIFLSEEALAGSVVQFVSKRLRS